MSFIYARMVKAKPFQSDSLDRLAKTMNATKILKKGKLKRYYKVPNLIRGCMSYFDAILFDAKYYNNLSSEERLAVGAHEFNHIIQNHDIEKFKRQILPGLVIGTLLALLTFYFDLFSYFITLSQSGRILFSVSILLVSCVIFMMASFYFNANWLRQTETQSDLSAVNFANGEALISALTKLHKLYPKKSNRLESRLLPKTYPTLEERITAIRNAMENRIL